VAGHHIAVAAVVARAAKEMHQPVPGRCGHLRGDIGNAAACVFHQDQAGNGEGLHGETVQTGHLLGGYDVLHIGLILWFFVRIRGVEDHHCHRRVITVAQTDQNAKAS